MTELSDFVRFRNRLSTSLRRIHLSTIYLGLAVALAIAWAWSLFAAPAVLPSAPVKPTSVPSQAQLLNVTPENEKGGTAPMNSTTPGANNTQNSQTNVQATDSGTTVTVNGQTETVPPNQPFQKSYDTTGGSTTTHTDVSISNTTDTTGRNVTLNVQSSSHSSASGTKVEGGQ